MVYNAKGNVSNSNEYLLRKLYRLYDIMNRVVEIVIIELSRVASYFASKALYFFDLFPRNICSALLLPVARNRARKNGQSISQGEISIYGLMPGLMTYAPASPLNTKLTDMSNMSANNSLFSQKLPYPGQV